MEEREQFCRRCGTRLGVREHIFGTLAVLNMKVADKSVVSVLPADVVCATRVDVSVWYALPSKPISKPE